MSRVHRRQAAQKRRKKMGSSVAYRTRGTVLSQEGRGEASGPTTDRHSKAMESSGTSQTAAVQQLLGGVFAQRAHSAGTAPIITVLIQVTTLKPPPLRNHAQSIQNSNIQTSDACHGSQGPKFCPL